MSRLAVLTVRNEGPFLLEWLAHHKAVGFNDFLVYSNDCEDGTDEMLDRLQSLGVLTHVRNPGPYEQNGIQFTALNAASKHPKVKKANWLLPLDIDEFVNIHIGNHTLAALFAELPDATAFTLTWRLFGNAGEIRFKDAPVTETFTRAAPAVMNWPWRAAMFKTLYRNDGTYRRLGVHRPRDPVKDRVESTRWYDGSGRELPDQFRTRRIFSNFGQNNYKLVQLNHYPLGAMESYLIKADRGRAVHSEHMLGLDYWVERNFNSDIDSSVLKLKPKRDEIIAEFRADSELVRLHDFSVAWRKARFETLLLEEPYRALFGRLLMAQPSRPLNAKAAQFLIKFGTKSKNHK